MGVFQRSRNQVKRPWKVVLLGLVMAFAAIGIFFGLAAVVVVEEESRHDSTKGVLLHQTVKGGSSSVVGWWLAVSGMCFFRTSSLISLISLTPMPVVSSASTAL